MNDFVFEPLDNKTAKIILQGDFSYSLSKSQIKNFQSITNNFEKIIFDFDKIKSIDFVALSFFLLNVKSFQIINANEKVALLVKTFKNLHEKDLSKSEEALREKKNYSKKFFEDVLDFLNFLGLTLYHIYLTVKSPKNFRFRSFLYHLNENGFQALPVALLTTFIVSYAITLQGAIQLAKLGAPLLSVDTTAKLSLREIGPFILALVIAGRSSSSFASQLSSMKITEEIAAMKSMDFNIYHFLVIPRVLTLIIAMPLLVFLSDIVSLFAGMVAIKMELGISFGQYLDRFYEAVGFNHFLVGVVKAPFFGAAIALVGTYRGLINVQENRAISHNVIKSVINALFWIIAINAIASIVFTRVLIS